MYPTVKHLVGSVQLDFLYFIVLGIILFSVLSFLLLTWLHHITDAAVLQAPDEVEEAVFLHAE